MPSSPTSSAVVHSADHDHLLAVFESVPDPRDRRGIRYPLAGVLALAVTATLAGARSFTAIGQWAADQAVEVLSAFGITSSVPEESTLRKLFARLDADALDAALGVWAWTRSLVVGARRVVAIDGKTVRGARNHADRTSVAPHLVAAFDHAAGVVLGQVAVAAKSNEIPAARTLLELLDLDGAVVTMDALHTQRDTAALITDAGGDYVFTVKKNMPTLFHHHTMLPWQHIPATRSTTIGRGRRVTRTIKVAAVPDWIDFPGAAQVAQVRRTVTRKGRKTVEVVYLITSADHLAAPPEVLAGWIQGHWGIENRLHWVRDVAFGEDLSQVRTGQAPRIMATCRNLAISLLRLAGWDSIAEGLRHLARHPDHAATLVLT